MAAPSTMKSDFRWHMKTSDGAMPATPYHNSVKGHEYVEVPKMYCKYTISDFKYPSDGSITFNYNVTIYVTEALGDRCYGEPYYTMAAIVWYSGNTFVGGKVITENAKAPDGTVGVINFPSYRSSNSYTFKGTATIPKSHCNHDKAITNICIALNNNCDCHSKSHKFYAWKDCPAYYIGDPRYIGKTPTKSPSVSEVLTRYQVIDGIAKNRTTGEESKIIYYNSGNFHNYDHKFGYKFKNALGEESGYKSYDSANLPKISKSLSSVKYYVSQRVFDYRYTQASDWSSWVHYLTYRGVLHYPASVNYSPSVIMYGSSISPNISPYSNNPSGVTTYQSIIRNKNDSEDYAFYLDEWSSSPYTNQLTNTYYLCSYSDDTVNEAYLSSFRWKGSFTELYSVPSGTSPAIKRINRSQLSKSQLIKVKLNKPKSLSFDHQLSVGERITTSSTDNLNIIKPDKYPNNQTPVVSYYEGNNKFEGTRVLSSGQDNKFRASVKYTSNFQESSDETFTSSNLEVLYCPCNMTDFEYTVNFRYYNGTSYETIDSGDIISPGTSLQIEFSQFNIENHLGNFNYYEVLLYKNNSEFKIITEGDYNNTGSKTVNFNLPDYDVLQPSSNDDFKLGLRCCYKDSTSVYRVPGDGNIHHIVNIKSDSNIFTSKGFSCSDLPQVPVVVYPFHLSSVYSFADILSSSKLLFIIDEETQNYSNTVLTVKEDIELSYNIVARVLSYSDLQNYDTTNLQNNDVVRVLTDETRGNDTSYYKWSSSGTTWEYITVEESELTIYKGSVPGQNGSPYLIDDSEGYYRWNNLNNKIKIISRIAGKYVRDYIEFINKNRSTKIDYYLNENEFESNHYSLYGVKLSGLSEGHYYSITINSKNTNNQSSSCTFIVRVINDYDLSDIPIPQKYTPIKEDDISLIYNLLSVSWNSIVLHFNLLDDNDIKIINESLNSEDKISLNDLTQTHLEIPFKYKTSYKFIKSIYQVLSRLYYKTLICTNYGPECKVKLVDNTLQVTGRNLIETGGTFDIFNYLMSTYRILGQRYFYRNLKNINHYYEDLEENEPSDWRSTYNKLYYIKVSSDPDVYELNSETNWNIAKLQTLYKRSTDKVYYGSSTPLVDSQISNDYGEGFPIFGKWFPIIFRDNIIRYVSYLDGISITASPMFKKDYNNGISVNITDNLPIQSNMIFSCDTKLVNPQDYVDCGLMFESLKGDPPYLVFREISDDYFDNFLGYIHGLLTKML